jgi:hypothetical protein
MFTRGIALSRARSRVPSRFALRLNSSEQEFGMHRSKVDIPTHESICRRLIVSQSVRNQPQHLKFS